MSLNPAVLKKLTYLRRIASDEEASPVKEQPFPGIHDSCLNFVNKDFQSSVF